jgi:hypothetical protein
MADNTLKGGTFCIALTFIGDGYPFRGLCPGADVNGEAVGMRLTIGPKAVGEGYVSII